MTLKRDHRDEHPGCKVMWPWLRWCSNYRYASQLVGYALEDIKTYPEKELNARFKICKQYDDVTKHRSGVRSAYIAIRERFNEDDLFDVESMTDSMIRSFGMDHNFFEGRTREEEIAYQLFHRQQGKAVDVLYAYGMFDKRTGKIELDNLKKLR